MSNPFRWICIGACTLVAGVAIGEYTRARAQAGAPSAPTRRPFAKPGTPRKPERLRRT